MYRLAAVLFFTLLPGSAPRDTVSTEQFKELMATLAAAWSSQDTERGVSCFTPDATYMQPPDQQFFRGSAELRRYFGALEPGTFMTFHNISFDPARQMGFGEFSFGTRGEPQADHGVAVVEVREGKIASWREYFSKGPADFRVFVAAEGKTWKWNIRNYE